MRLDALQEAAARLLHDADDRRRLRDPTTDPASFGLDADALEWLRGFDACALDVASRALPSTWLARLAGRFPRTLVLLQRHAPSILGTGLASLPGMDDEIALGRLVGSVRAGDEGRRLRDAYALEASLLRSARLTTETIPPGRRLRFLVEEAAVETEGDLGALDAATYPARSGCYLAWSEGGRAHVVERPRVEGLLDRVAAADSLDALLGNAGDHERGLVASWLRSGLLRAR